MGSDKPIKLRGSRKAMPILSNAISWLFAPLSSQPATRHRPGSSSARRHRSSLCVRETDGCVGVVHDVAPPGGAFPQLCGALPAVCCAGRGRGDGNCLADRRRGLTLPPHARAWGGNFVTGEKKGACAAHSGWQDRARLRAGAAAARLPPRPTRPGAAAAPVPRPDAGSLQTRAWPHKARRPPI
jgi:hypothetical protein